MNAPECRDFLRRRFDGLTPAGRRALEQHLAACPHCRDWHRAARLLEDGLRALPRPEPPPGLSDRIVLRVTADRRDRLRRRQRLAGLAAAACLLLTPLAIDLLARRDAGPVPTRPHVVRKAPQAPPQAAPAPSLRQSVDEAGSAVAALTHRLTGQTRDRARLLWGAAKPPGGAAALPDLDGLRAPLDPAAQPLREAGRGVSAGLETVAGSARRAVSFFTREIPALDPGRKILD
jgi:hypothetical protein